MVIDRAKTVRGAFAGAVAAGVWAAQQPARQAGVRRRLRRHASCSARPSRAGARGRSSALAMHLGNGALMGAAYADVAPRMPLPSWSRGPIVALAEHLATWPLTVAVDRVHPARDELPRLAGSWRAFAQATWRHLLFGVVLGELERRLNAAAGSRAAAVRARRVEQRARPARARRHAGLTCLPDAVRGNRSIGDAFRPHPSTRQRHAGGVDRRQPRPSWPDVADSARPRRPSAGSCARRCATRPPSCCCAERCGRRACGAGGARQDAPRQARPRVHRPQARGLRRRRLAGTATPTTTTASPAARARRSPRTASATRASTPIPPSLGWEVLRLWAGEVEQDPAGRDLPVAGALARRQRDRRCESLRGIRSILKRWPGTTESPPSDSNRKPLHYK